MQIMVGQGQGLGVSISNKHPDNADAAGAQTAL